MQITSAMLNNLRKDFGSTVSELEKKYNVKIELGNGRFNDSSATFKLIVTGNGENGEVIDNNENQFMQYCEVFGFKKSDFGKTFFNMSGSYEICGIKPSSYKYPILGKNVITGKIYKFPADVVKMSLK